jgi:hypothetical protein
LIIGAPSASAAFFRTERRQIISVGLASLARPRIILALHLRDSAKSAQSRGGSGCP